MTKMIDAEGDALPNNGPDDKYDNCWDINLWGDGELSLSIPMYFDAGDGGNYNGAGVVTVGLRELLQEYLDDCDRLDGGEGLQPLAAMFSVFADKYEAAAKAPNTRGKLVASLAVLRMNFPGIKLQPVGTLPEPKRKSK